MKDWVLGDGCIELSEGKTKVLVYTRFFGFRRGMARASILEGKLCVESIGEQWKWPWN